MKLLRHRYVSVFGFIFPFLLVGCTETGNSGTPEITPVVGPASLSDFVPGSEYVRTSKGELVQQWRMEAQLADIAKDVALSLAEPAVRAGVYDAVQESPIREHKLHFRSLLEEDVGGLRSTMARARGVAGSSVLAKLDSVVDLEFYMPVKEHLAKWTKDSDLLVLSYPSDDGSVPHAFNLMGEEVEVSMATPPDVPTLVLTAVETDFQSPRSLRSFREEDQSVAMLEDPVTGGHWLMSHLSIPDVKESWALGDPEIEIHMFWKETSGEWTDQICAGGDRASPYYFDMNGTSWSGSVTIATENFIGERVIEYQVWEDDNGPCSGVTGGRPPKTTSDVSWDLYDYGTRALNIYLSQPQDPNVELKRIAVVAANIRPTFDVVQELQKDDFIGIMDGPSDGCWPIYNEPVFSIKDNDGFNRGWGNVDPTYGEKTPECSPTSVSLDGPVNVCDSQSSAQFFADVEGAGPFQFTWRVDGSTQYGATTDTFQWSNFSIGDYNIEVEVLDQGSSIQVSDNMISHVVDC